MNTTDKHRLWVRNQIEALGCDETFEESRDGTPLCQRCGCGGNMECGHEPLNEARGCTMHPSFPTCPCCGVGGKPMTDAEYDKETGQAGLFEIDGQRGG
jgi:hypothetical protein